MHDSEDLHETDNSGAASRVRHYASAYPLSFLFVFMVWAFIITAHVFDAGRHIEDTSFTPLSLASEALAAEPPSLCPVPAPCPTCSTCPSCPVSTTQTAPQPAVSGTEANMLATWVGLVLAVPPIVNEAEDLNYFIVNIGAGNGQHVPPGAANSDATADTQFYTSQLGHCGLAVEPSDGFGALMKNLPAKCIHKIQDISTPDGICRQLEEAKSPKRPRLFKIDTDGYDFDTTQKVLASGYRPMFVFVEINEKIPPPIVHCVHYRTGIQWSYHGPSHCYGCSVQAYVDMMKKYDYELVLVHWNDALFVHNIYKHAVEQLYVPGGGQLPSVEDAYNRGYRHRVDRQAHFPWNADVDAWLTDTRPADQRVKDIRAHMLRSPHCANYPSDLLETAIGGQPS